MNKYDVLGVVGEGAYGVVLKCKNKDWLVRSSVGEAWTSVARGKAGDWDPGQHQNAFVGVLGPSSI